ncbi:MAG: glycosyltransferase family A protein, partial [Anaerolineales bacterium]
MTTSSPRITVIVNSYNSRPYIAEALDSVLAQTLAPFELLVMDDGSTDGTADVVRAYGPRVQWHQQPRAGVAAARNNIVPRARGDLIAFLDADDFWTPTKLEIQAAAFRASPTPDAVFGHVQQLISPDLDPAV